MLKKTAAEKFVDSINRLMTDKVQTILDEVGRLRACLESGSLCERRLDARCRYSFPDGSIAYVRKKWVRGSKFEAHT